MEKEDFKHHNPILEKAFSLDNASILEIRKARIKEIMKLFGKHEKDSGSPAVQACIINEHFLMMVSHVKYHPKDHLSFYHLQRIINKRKKIMYYLRDKDYNTYAYILKYYESKDIGGYHKLPKEIKHVNIHHR